MNFGDAIQAMKGGQRATRPGWNGKGMYVYLSNMTELVPTAGWQPCFVMHTADHKEQPGWLASQADMLAEDWLVVR